MMPRDFFTAERLSVRVPDRPPGILFHFTLLDRAFAILESGHIRGNRGISTTENPSLSGPGAFVFILDPVCILSQGFGLWPHVWQRGYEQEAEWVVVAPDAEYEKSANVLFTETVRLPLDCVVEIGHQPGINPRQMALVPALRQAAAKFGIPVKVYYWEEWWRNGVRADDWK